MNTPHFTWDARILEEMGEPTVRAIGESGHEITFPVGDAASLFERCVENLRKDGFANKLSPFFQSTRLGIYVPKGYLDQDG